MESDHFGHGRPINFIGIYMTGKARQVVRTGRTQAQKDAERTTREQEEALKTQQQREQLEAAEAEDEIARRKLRARTGGRRSLIEARPGLATNLGGTASA